MKNVWITADTHFHHHRLSERYGIRGQGFTKKIIDRWREIILEDDLVIHLGDVTWDYRGLKDLMNSLPGRKILTLGNHDKRSANWFMDNGFDFACREFNYRDILFTHKPQYVDIDKRDHTHLNVHGHIHIPNKKGYKIINNNFHRLYSLEVEKYRPSKIERFLLKSKKAEYYTDFLTEYEKR